MFSKNYQKFYRVYIIYYQAHIWEKTIIYIFKKLKAFRRTRHFFCVTYIHIYIYIFFFSKMFFEINQIDWYQNQVDWTSNESTGAFAKSKIEN